MGIIFSIEKAYRLFKEKNWNTIYWAIDLHETCINPKSIDSNLSWVNEDAKKCLQLISSLEESSIILWSSSYQDYLTKVKNWMESQDINIAYINKNLSEYNSEYTCFNSKFYFNILIDDKAGFNPGTDWRIIYEYLISKNSECSSS